MRFYLLIIIVFAISSCSDVKKVETLYDDGQVMEEFYTLKDDASIKHGVYNRFDENSNLLETSDYVNGVLEGERILFYPTGKIMILENYSKGAFNGPYASFYESGNKNEEGSYTDNQMWGDWNYYYDLPDARLKETVRFINSMENGPFKEYYESGKLKAEGSYMDEYENGLYREFDEAGILVKEIVYDNGRPMMYKEYDAEGNVVKESDYTTMP